MATEISSIGKEALLSRLFEGSGRTNERGCTFSGDGDFSTVHKVFMEKVDFDLTYNRHHGCSQGTRRGASGPGLDSLGGRNGGEHRGLGFCR